MTNNPQILVAISCITYNHKDYLRQCLDGFVMQQTNSRFVAVVHDDCSTDGTTDILREYAEKYPEIIIPIYEEENLFQQGKMSEISRKVEEIITNSGAIYEAICEGDDYWTDPLKLQKQVDFLESHPDYSLCFHRCQTLISETGEIVDEFIVPDMPRESSIEDLSKGNYIHTLSVVYRRNDEVQRKISSLGPCMPGDYVLWMMHAEKGKIWKFEEPMGVYRYGSGIWTTGRGLGNELAFLMTLVKLWMSIDNPIAKQNLQQQIDKQRQAIIGYEEKEYKELCSTRASKAYRIGKILTAPATWWRKWKK